MKLFLILIFVILLHCAKDNKNSFDPEDIPKGIVSCKYTDDLIIYGNQDCTRMFCRNSGECSLKNGSTWKGGIVCPAVKSTDSISCPKAHECLTAKTPGLKEARMNVQTKGEITSYSLNYKCPGSISPFGKKVPL